MVAAKQYETVAKHYGRVSETQLVFLGKRQRRSPQVVNYYGDSKFIRRSIFNAQKHPRVRIKCFVRNSGAGNGCANFMGAWKNAFFLQEKEPMPIKFRVLGGVFLFFFGGGGGSADFSFMGARIFLKIAIGIELFRSQGPLGICWGGVPIFFLWARGFF